MQMLMTKTLTKCILRYDLSNKVLVPGHTDKTTIINNLIMFYLQNDSYDADMTFSKNCPMNSLKTYMLL